MREGPWSYRIISLIAVSPIYACVLVTVGTAAGRHVFFKDMAFKIFGRFVPSSLMPAPAPIIPRFLPPNLALRTAKPRP